MLRMVRVETEREYEELWRAFNNELIDEPFLPKGYYQEEHVHLSMTPEFKMIADKKMEMVRGNRGKEDVEMLHRGHSEEGKDNGEEHWEEGSERGLLGGTHNETMVAYGTINR